MFKSEQQKRITYLRLFLFRFHLHINFKVGRERAEHSIL